MLQLKIVFAVFCVQILISGIFGADKYTDENRPYEFGFTIEGEQHRHEKKDENGIIMGEFGFITADGVYHVTVYATDEQGRFKILSMKNIRVKPYPTAEVRKGHSIPFPPSENAPVIQGPTTSKVNLEKIPEPIKKPVASPAKSCSHCSLPTTTTKAPKFADIDIVSKDLLAPNAIPSSGFVSQNIPTYQESQPQIQKSGGQAIISQQESGHEQSVPGFGHQNTPYSSTFGQSKPQYQHPNTIQNRFGGQENYAQQEHSIGQYSPLNSFSGIAKADNNKNYPPSNNAKSNINLHEKDTNLYIQKGDQNSANVKYPSQRTNENSYSPQKENDNVQKYSQQQSDNNYNNYAQQAQSSDQPLPGAGLPNIPQSEISGITQTSLRNPKQYNNVLSSNSETDPPQGFRDIISLSSQANQPLDNKPTLVAAQMQIVPKDTNIHHKHPGEEEGLPEGLSRDDMTQLLYTFNYSVGFHGHHEKGYRSGAKQGYYYVTGRNGVRTRIDYIADENGYRPRISQDVLDLSSEDVPKEETEKDEKFGLKGYEFKWLYFPANDAKHQ